MKQFYGTGVALVTPFNEDGSLDLAGLGRVLEHTAKGVDYYVVQGTTGESPTTTQEEKMALLRYVVEHNPKQLPIVFGLGGNNTAAVLDRLKDSDLTGVSALLSVAPYYNKPTQAGFVAHFKAVADASPLPLILYNVPGRTAENMTAETILELAQHPNILGVKEAAGDVVQAMAIAKGKPDDFLLISGDDQLTLALMAVGAVGVISVLANLIPETFKGLVHSALAGNFSEALPYAQSLLEINDLMYEESNPVGVKAAMALQGICPDAVRMPLLAASPDLRTRIQAVLNSRDWR